jgi:hypothetical protein
MSAGPTVRVDLRAALPVAVLAIVVLAIIVVELCGRDDVKGPPAAPTASGPTATPGPTFTPGPTSTPGGATETPTAGGAPAGSEDERDAQRQQDVAAIQQALELYRSNEGEYPNTNGNIQTLCVFEDSDAGCDLLDILDPIPQDPLGDPAANGYFYASDGETFTLWATREGETLPECGEHPEHLANIDSLYCVRGP